MMNTSLGLRSAWPAEGHLPRLSGDTVWLNSQPLDSQDLHGKVVLIDFWTYTCVNWTRTLPYLRAWAGKYKDRGLIVIGVHTPEFSFERDVSNVREMVRRLGVDYPVAIDSDYATWNAFGNQYWPALYVVDAEGRIRHHQFGEGDYVRLEQIVQQLLVEAGHKGIEPAVVSVSPQGAEVGADLTELKSPETYVGYGRSDTFSSQDTLLHDRARFYTPPPLMRLNEWALAGRWKATRESVQAVELGARILYRFHARDLNLVMGPAQGGTPIRFRVLIDGNAPGGSHGEDVDEQGFGTLDMPRMYQLIRQPANIQDRRMEIEFLDSGAAVFDFTFG